MSFSANKIFLVEFGRVEEGGDHNPVGKLPACQRGMGFGTHVRI